MATDLQHRRVDVRRSCFRGAIVSLALFLSLTGVAATDFEFLRTYVDLSYGGNGRPGWVQPGDMDGDGDLDIVAGGGSALYVYEKTAQGWTRHGTLDGSGAIGSNGAVVTDVDGDGDLDVVAAKYKSDLGWWENPGGSLRTVSWTFHRFAGGLNDWFLHDLILCDLDKDGVANEYLAVLQRGYWDAPFHVYWYRPNANPFQDWSRYTVTQNQAGPNNNHAGVDVADIDADGDIDISMSNGWFESSGSPTGSWTWHAVAGLYGVSNSLIRDIDRDGDMDLVMSAGHHGQGVYWFENQGNPRGGTWLRHDVSPTAGSVTSRRVYDAGPDYLHHPEGLQVADIDQDGDLDILTCELFFGEDPGEPDWSEQRHNLYIYENLGGATPTWRQANISPNSYPSHLPYLVDMNGDGRLDVISEATGYSVISYYENATAPSSGVPEISFSLESVDTAYRGNGRPGWSASGDIDGDGVVDVVSGGGQAIQWYEGPDWTRFAIENPTQTGGNGGLVLDVDRDGDLDVIAALFNDSLVWWENPGPTAVTGSWVRRSIDSSGAASNFNHDLALGDLDDDGEPEVVALYVGGGVYWYDIPSSPTSSVWPKTRILANIDDPYVGLAVGDIDRDGDLDVVASNRWYENPSNPSTADWTGRTIFPGAVQNVTVYDVDRDGRVDVVGAEGFVYPNGRVQWAEAPADPRTGGWTIRLVSGGLDGPENIWAGDLNRDGWTDIVTGEMGTSDGFNDNDSNLIVFVGADADGLQWTQNTVGQNVGVSARIDPTDIDGDGDTDFTADGNAEDHIYLWRNTTPVSSSGVPLPPTAIRVE